MHLPNLMDYGEGAEGRADQIAEPIMDDSPGLSAETSLPASSTTRVYPPIAYFGLDSEHPGVLRRITALRRVSARVLVCSFRRLNNKGRTLPDRADIPLGVIADRNYLGRLKKLANAARVIWGARRQFSTASSFYARNLDLALLAWFAQIVARSKAPMVYEVLDIMPVLSGSALTSRLLRWIERRVLAHAKLLVVSSPGFMEHYFVPMQHYRGKWFLMENKIVAHGLGVSESLPTKDSKQKLNEIKGQRWVIGWFGAFRCSRSLSILEHLCQALPDKLMVYLRGYPTAIDAGRFREVIDRNPAMIFDGEYSSPGDLQDIYAAIDLSWNFDFLDRRGNSDWLLPNRLYHGGYFGIPALTSEQTEAGRRIKELGIGWVFNEPAEQNLVDFFDRLTHREMSEMKAHIAGLPKSLFCDDDDICRLFDAILASSPQSSRAMPQVGLVIDSSRNSKLREQ